MLYVLFSERDTSVGNLLPRRDGVVIESLDSFLAHVDDVPAGARFCHLGCFNHQEDVAFHLAYFRVGAHKGWSTNYTIVPLSPSPNEFTIPPPLTAVNV